MSITRSPGKKFFPFGSVSMTWTQICAVLAAGNLRRLCLKLDEQFVKEKLFTGWSSDTHIRQAGLIFGLDSCGTLRFAYNGHFFLWIDFSEKVTFFTLIINNSHVTPLLRSPRSAPMEWTSVIMEMCCTNWWNYLRGRNGAKGRNIDFSQNGKNLTNASLAWRMLVSSLWTLKRRDSSHSKDSKTVLIRLLASSWQILRHQTLSQPENTKKTAQIWIWFTKSRITLHQVVRSSPFDFQGTFQTLLHQSGPTCPKTVSNIFLPSSRLRWNVS